MTLVNYVEINIKAIIHNTTCHYCMAMPKYAQVRLPICPPYITGLKQIVLRSDSLLVMKE